MANETSGRRLARKPIPLAVIAPPRRLTECTQCGKCCTYVAVDIDKPTGVRAVTNILWYLYHEQVSVYADGDGDWSVVFETRCRNLGADLLCGIYPRRPHVCRDFDNTSCEVNSPDEGLTFTTAEGFLSWLQARRPRLHAKVVARFAPWPEEVRGESRRTS